MTILYQYISRELLDVEIAQCRDSWWTKYHSALILITVRQYNYPPSSSDRRKVLMSKYLLYYYHPAQVMIISYQDISRELLELEIAQYRDSDGINMTQLWSWSQYDSTITHLAPVIVGECNIEILIVLLSPSSKLWSFYIRTNSRELLELEIAQYRDCDGINMTQLWSWSQYDSTITHLAPVIVGQC